NVDADRAPALAPNSKHYLEADYLGDKDAFVISPKYRNEYIGTGPYKMTAWDGGVQMDLARFDDYWEGRPPLDKVIFHIVSDTNSAVAEILSGAFDMVMPPTVSTENATEIKKRREGTGNVVRSE